MFDSDEADSKREEIGIFETSLGKIMGTKAQTIVGELKCEGHEGRGTIIIRAMSPKEEQRPAE